MVKIRILLLLSVLVGVLALIYVLLPAPAATQNRYQLSLNRTKANRYFLPLAGRKQPPSRDYYPHHQSPSGSPHELFEDGEEPSTPLPEICSTSNSFQIDRASDFQESAAIWQSDSRQRQSQKSAIFSPPLLSRRKSPTVIPPSPALHHPLDQEGFPTAESSQSDYPYILWRRMQIEDNDTLVLDLRLCSNPDCHYTGGAIVGQVIPEGWEILTTIPAFHARDQQRREIKWLFTTILPDQEEHLKIVLKPVKTGDLTVLAENSTFYRSRQTAEPKITEFPCREQEE